MLKLPKGLKKKKKDKKSKRDKELFTEEELEQYKREQQLKQQKLQESETEVLSETETKLDIQPEKQPGGDEEWCKFKALTAGVDSILHKTQDDLDRIKSTSFFQRVPPPSERKRAEEEEEAAREADRLEQERLKKEEEEANRDKLTEAVVELSESEEESEELDDIFNTEYIEAITSGEVQLTVIPDSPEFDITEGPDPFDTSYAEKLIKGPEISKRGKKLVSIGAAVEVLTGRVDSAQTLAGGGVKRKQRRGPQNLLLDDLEEDTIIPESVAVESPEPVKTLLDDPADEIPDIPIDLSVSLHLALLKDKQENLEEVKNLDIVSEFDILKDDEDDEFAELATESLTKKEEVVVLTEVQPLQFVGEVSGDWAEFKQDESDITKVKPPRPPAFRRPSPEGAEADPLSDDDFNLEGEDPFDTTFVEKVLLAEDDFDFDPRAGEQNPKKQSFVKDLLNESDFPKLSIAPIVPLQENSSKVNDPFDTSIIENIVQPKTVELKILEEQLITKTNLKQSLSDPDFDPRAEELPVNTESEEINLARRKSSLHLNVSKAVGFIVPEKDLLSLDHDGGKIRDPLTPYYAPEVPVLEEKTEDPFDTSFVPDSQPTQIELNIIENELLKSSVLQKSLSDPDFDPRVEEKLEKGDKRYIESDLLAVEEELNIKVLTPAQEKKKSVGVSFVDPFDTSIALNIQPGQIELKILEEELLPTINEIIETAVLDTLTDAQELGLGDKVLTPQTNFAEHNLSSEIDPFDTSFAENLKPGQAEIKVIESELIN